MRTADEGTRRHPPEPKLRADARRNREKVLRAAREAFAESGNDVPLDEIAVRAGVGAGTVYRHFPSKEALFEAVATARVEALIADSLSVQRRRDDAQLADGDRVWVAPAARTLRGHRRTSPYAVIRAADRKVFWATGLPMPGQGW